MASSDEDKEGSVSISSVFIDSLKSNNNNGDVLSPEEIEWVDSCLVKDPDSDWTSMKDALVEILGLQPHSNDDVKAISNGTDVDMIMTPSARPWVVKSSETINNDGDDFTATDVDMTSFSRASNNENVVDYDGDDSMLVSKDSNGSSEDGFAVEEDTGISLPEHFQEDVSESSLKNVFLPHYREDYQSASGSGDSGILDVGSWMYETERSSIQDHDIFKVWDLGTQSDEDEDYELVKQLKKALSESSAEALAAPQATDDSRAWKDLKVESIDDLIAGISNLSLNQVLK